MLTRVIETSLDSRRDADQDDDHSPSSWHIDVKSSSAASVDRVSL
jgi:hypothetical protein